MKACFCWNARRSGYFRSSIPGMVGDHIRLELAKSRAELSIAKLELDTATAKLSFAIKSMSEFLISLESPKETDLQFVTNVPSAVSRDSIQRAPLGTSIGEPQTIGSAGDVWAAWATNSHRHKNTWPGD